MTIVVNTTMMTSGVMNLSLIHIFAPEHLQAVLEAGRLAPTGKNHQPQRLLVVQSPEGLEKMAKAMHNTNAYTAKAVIMVCSDTSDCWVRSFDGHCIHEIDASIVTTYMMLAATEQGLGSLWVERFNPDVYKRQGKWCITSVKMP